MTASISRNAFFYGMTESLGQTAITYTLSTARYTVKAYDIVTSPEARQTYQWVKEMGIALGQLAFWSAVWAYAKTQGWVDAEVAAALPTEADHIADASNMVESDPFAPESNPAYAAVAATITAPVVTLVVPTAKTYQAMTTTELRKACQEAGIKWRNAHAKGKHLSKAEMVAALS
jgi:hypothetical protein